MTRHSTGARSVKRRLRILKAIQRQGSGVYRTAVLRVPFADLDPFWRYQIARWTTAFHARWRAEGQKGSALCLTCDTEFPPNEPATMAVLLPYVDAPPEAFVFSPVCEACATRTDDEISGAMAKSLIREPYAVPASQVHRAAGHA